MRFGTSNLKVTISGIEYTWLGGFGCVLKSFERGVKQGQVRVIGDVIFYAIYINNCGWTREVSWIPQQRIDCDWIRECKAAIFN